MGVKLRKRSLKERYRYYLDIHESGKRKSEFLNVYLYKRPRNPMEKAHNDESKRVAEAIRAKRELELGAADYDVQVTSRRRIDFFQYCSDFLESYAKKDIRMIEASVRYLKEYNKAATLAPKAITEGFCQNFKDWLEAHPNLSGDTPHDYFSKFKKIIKAAVRDKILVTNPAAEVKNTTDKTRISKDILNVDELNALGRTQCGNLHVKRAFLFACNTGLRFCDIVEMKWGDIRDGALTIQQQKTERKVTVNLNTTAQKILGEPGQPSEKVFTLPSHTGVLKSLQAWGAKAEVKKHITFHVARHSFATNLLIYDTDLKSVASLLGHSGLNHVGKYVRVVSELKQRGVDKLPEINFE
jgi:integrase/recombinase XerD